MYKNCLTERSANRQRELEQGLLGMMQQKNYEDITVSDLCQHLQIPRKSFYRYFSGKDGALHALIDHTLVDFFKVPKEMENRKSGLDDLMLFFSYWYENRIFLKALQRSGLSGIWMERANAFAMREGYIPRQFKFLPPEKQNIAMSFVICGLLSMTLNWYRQGFPISAGEMTRLATEMLTTPLLRP